MCMWAGKKQIQYDSSRQKFILCTTIIYDYNVITAEVYNDNENGPEFDYTILVDFIKII